jgi:hypothetical protein
VQRLIEHAPRFGYGLFVTMGLLTLSNRFLGAPQSFPVAVALAIAGGLLATRLARPPR